YVDYSFAQGRPLQAFHVDVGEDGIDLVHLGEHGERMGARESPRDLEAGGRQGSREKMADGVVVVDEEDVSAHVADARARAVPRRSPRSADAVGVATSRPPWR